jgi:xanthine dehydrogenase YagS FAD-binding subunit
VKPFGYKKPGDDEAAISSGKDSGALFIAGGTNVVDLLRIGVLEPTELVDVNALAWSRIEPTADGGLRLGALASNTDVAYHPDVRAHYPLLSEAILSGASPQIRNMASVGGNMLQRTRCAYFRDVGVSACNKRSPGSGCAAMDGYTRMHAVLGGSDHCIAVHPSDMCVALAALEATVQVKGPSGERTIPFGSLHVLPGGRPDLETTLAKGELITAVVLPKLPFAARSAYVKVRDRASFAFALASAAVALDLAGGTIRDARVALGGVATKPWRCPEAEAVLKGQPASASVFAGAADAALSRARAYAGNDFKIALAKRTLVRALERAGAAT